VKAIVVWGTFKPASFVVVMFSNRCEKARYITFASRKLPMKIRKDIGSNGDSSQSRAIIRRDNSVEKNFN
jgi:hypothetical protein